MFWNNSKYFRNGISIPPNVAFIGLYCLDLCNYWQPWELESLTVSVRRARPWGDGLAHLSSSHVWQKFHKFLLFWSNSKFLSQTFFYCPNFGGQIFCLSYWSWIILPVCQSILKKPRSPLLLIYIGGCQVEQDVFYLLARQVSPVCRLEQLSCLLF